MKALGGQWISWADKAQTDWSVVGESRVEELSPRGEGIRGELPLVYPIVSGPWHELAEPDELVPRTERAIQWVLATEGVHCTLVAFASVEELEEGLGGDGGKCRRLIRLFSKSVRGVGKCGIPCKGFPCGGNRPAVEPTWSGLTLGTRRMR